MATYPDPTPCPRILYGCAFKGDQTKELVLQAFRMGYRGIDTAGVANNYNEAQAGQAIQQLINEGVVQRHEVYIQTKFSPCKPDRDPSIYPYDTTAPLEEQVRQSIASSLRHFTFTCPPSSSSPNTEQQQPYLDSLILHSTYPDLPSTVRVWKTLEAYVPHSIRHLGISNIDLPLLQAIYAEATVKPAAVQNRLTDSIDPLNTLPVPTPVDIFDTQLRHWCRAHSVRYQPWGVVWGNDRVRDSAVVGKIADVLGVSRDVAVYCVVLGLEEVGCVFIGSTREERMRVGIEGLRAWERWVGGAKENSRVWGEWMGRCREEVGLW